MDDDFYEEDEPVEEVMEAFDAAPERGKTQESITIGGVTFTPEELRHLLSEGGANIFLIAEAAASVSLDRDGRAQTHHLCDERCRNNHTPKSP